MVNKILTVPQKVEDYKPFHLTGNEYVSLPLIDPDDGGIGQVNVISMGKNGIISFNGKSAPLFRPFFEKDGSEIGLRDNLKWTIHKNWIPQFVYEDDMFTFSGMIAAPVGVKGFLYILKSSNKTGRSAEVSMGLKSSWESSEVTVFHSRLINCVNCAGFNKWTNSLVFEIRPDTDLAAIACGTTEPLDVISWKGPDCSTKDEDIYVKNDGKSTIYAAQSGRFMVEPGCERTLAFYFGVNCEADGASTTMVDMKRRGSESMVYETLCWLDAHSVSLDHELEDLANRNLLFNYFYSSGVALDNEEIVPVTSRSPRYYVSAAFWSRDTFLWSFPGILLIDKNRGREILTACFKRYIKNAGIHSLYLNGSILYPGFELDELCAFIAGLKYYVDTAEDYGIVKEECILKGITRILDILFSFKDEKHMMFKTYLDPSDDPARHDFLIYSNAMVYASLKFIEEISAKLGLNLAGGYDISHVIKELKQTILEHGTQEVHGRRMFVWSTDLKGGYEVYENPPGSLQLLCYYGFAEKNCEIFINTVDWIYSKHNAYYSSGEMVSGTGCLHAQNPWPMSAAASLLCGMTERGIDFFKKASMDNGFACETVDPDTGIASTGLAFATCAGFIGYSIYKALHK